MRTILTAGLLVATLFAAVSATDTTLNTWFDYDRCAFCSTWAAQPGLVAHSHDQYRNLDDGIVWLTTVDKGYEKRLNDAMTAEGEVEARLEKGEQLPLCRYCAGIDALARKGVRIQPSLMDGAIVSVFLSTDTALVKEIQAFAAKAIAEMPSVNAAWVAAHSETK